MSKIMYIQSYVLKLDTEENWDINVCVRRERERESSGGMDTECGRGFLVLYTESGGSRIFSTYIYIGKWAS